ncbi:FimV/HubP family polar landmark protein [Chitinilyticum litopenaei]|uniref:FimV/HubP family polar landmark protein n=1 Tax=Chitinilyticum litopenaei TaxID=1121276 RepID=UPI000407D371|nr:FimV/HubP family polar landmark protein [Chitinilyticum litopenaei]
MLALSLAALPLLANAAGLGRMNVLSSLGEPFRGQIEIVGVQPSEADSLLVKLGSPEAHESAQLPYPGNMGLRFNVEKRKNGRYVVLVNSARPISEPFLDLIVELYWDGGNVKREFTALIDPPNYRAPAGTVDAEAGTITSDVLPGVRKTGKVRQGKKARPAEQSSAPQAQESAAAKPEAGADSYAVKSGDTLSGIARRVQPEGVSLDQVLLALYRANPQAFDGNMNRLKRGKILQVPSADEIKSVSSAEASREVKVQTENWQAYRTKLAESAARTPPAETKQGSAAGKITPKMDDKGASAPDSSKSTLKLSKADKGGKGDAAAKALEDEAAARKKSLEESNKRVGELQKNVKEMEQYISAKKASSASASASPVMAASAVGVASATVVASAASDASAAALAGAASEASEVAATPVPKPKRRPVPVPEPVEEPGLVDMLMENIVPLGGGLLALLAGAGAFIFMRRRQRAPVFEDSIITGSDLKANTVLGSTGGGVISTQPTENSFLTDFSRQGLGTIDTDEVDPIAEADVYMAYGRNAQAEEILKDALSKDPQRAEIRLKLLEIYAAAKDKSAFEAIAAELHAQTQGKGPLWEEAARMGRVLDADNPRYAGAVAAVATGVAAAAATGVAAAVAGVDLASQDVKPAEPAELDFEIATEPAAPAVAEADAFAAANAAADLDFSLDLGAPQAQSVAEPLVQPADEVMALDLPIDLESGEPEAGALELNALPGLDVADEFSALDLALPEAEAAAEELTASLPELGESLDDLPELSGFAEEPAADLGLDFDFDLNAPAEELLAAPVTSAAAESELADLNLDFAAGSDPATELDLASDDPVQTKIDLARAYIDMGDVEGAREILQEALQEGNAEQKSLAQSLLSGI